MFYSLSADITLTSAAVNERTIEMPNVTNAELHKLITQFQEDLNSKVDRMSRENTEANKVIADKIDSFGERLDRFDQRLDRIDGDHLVHANLNKLRLNLTKWTLSSLIT